MRSIRDVYHKILLRLKIFAYNQRKSRLQSAIAQKPQIKVVFFVLYDNMWKSDGLFQLLMDDEKFDPYIISTPYPHHPRDFSKTNQSRLEMCFKKIIEQLACDRHLQFINLYLNSLLYD